MKAKIWVIVLMTWAMALPEAKACTGITLHTQSNQPITARTIEWAATPLNTMLVVMPRGQKQVSFLPDGTKDGKQFVANYGYVGIAVEDNAFVMEGINEAGLGAGLFYFPDYGEYMPYKEEDKSLTVSDMQFVAEYGYVGIAVEDDAFVMEGVNEAGLGAGLFYFPDYGEYMPYKEEDKSLIVSDMQFVAWVLSTCATIDEMVALLPTIRVVGTDPRASTVHWRVTEPSGRQVVVEIVNQEVKVHENPLGVLTNSPSFDWHITNLNNYVNLMAGAVKEREIGALTLKAFSGGTGLHGMPGDMTSPSRFVRAAIFQSTAP